MSDFQYNPYLFDTSESEKSQLYILRGDITEFPVDVIVNSTNHNLIDGGGVNGAIHRVAGYELQQETMKFRRIHPGQAFVTMGYGLPGTYVIHTLGPRWQGGHHNEGEILETCYANSLKLAAGLGAKTIAFPCISTGAFKYPKKEAAIIAFNTIQKNLSKMFNWPVHVFIVCYDEENRRCLADAMTNHNHDREVKHAS